MAGQDQNEAVAKAIVLIGRGAWTAALLVASIIIFGIPAVIIGTVGEALVWIAERLKTPVDRACDSSKRIRVEIRAAIDAAKASQRSE
jgi:hypothetical protein